MDGEDVVRHGGVFVNTYAKLPALGSVVVLGIELPGGVRAEARGQVAWTQEHLSDDTPAGFGVRLIEPSADLCAMIAQFVRHREPLLRE
jgi:Tfp pilus assembly protein PilZ